MQTFRTSINLTPPISSWIALKTYDLSGSHLHLVLHMLHQKHQPPPLALLSYPVVMLNHTGGPTVARLSCGALLLLMKFPTRDEGLQHRPHLPHSTTALSCSDRPPLHHPPAGQPCLTVLHPSTLYAPSATPHLSHCEGNQRGKPWVGLANAARHFNHLCPYLSLI